MTSPDTAVRVHHDGRPLQGSLRLPGSKSITNRALLLAGLAAGHSRLSGVLASDDTRYMSAALQMMGVDIEQADSRTLMVTGVGALQRPAEALFLGNAGTATRFLTAAAALVNGTVTITGDEHMQKRPIAPLVAALNQLGVQASAPTGCPPVTITGAGGFCERQIAIDGALSSQYVSALLMLAPFAEESLTVSIQGGAIGARGYIDLTLACMAAFGARVDALGDACWQVHRSPYRPVDYAVEPDASAATYPWAAAALTGGTIDLGVSPEEMTQPDARAYDLIRQFPAMPGTIDGSQMQDAVPTLAVLAAFNRSPVRFIGIENLRVKECDRTRALATELSKLQPGLAVEEGDDLVVNAAPSLSGQRRDVSIHTYSDHRIAMSMALAGLRVYGLVVQDAACVDKTYPDYWRDLRSLGVGIEAISA